MMPDPTSASHGEVVHDPLAGDKDSSKEHGRPQSGADDQIRKDTIYLNAGKATRDDVQMTMCEAMDFFKTLDMSVRLTRGSTPQ